MEHEMNYILGTDCTKMFRFKQKVLTEPAGELEIYAKNMPRGVDLVVELRA